MKHRNIDLPQEYLQSLFDYRVDNGIGNLIWKGGRQRTTKGSIAGNVFRNTNGTVYKRRRVCIDGTLYSASRLVFVFFNGPVPKDMVVDHKDNNSLNNNINNLRAITQSENLKGRKMTRKSTTKNQIKE